MFFKYYKHDNTIENKLLFGSVRGVYAYENKKIVLDIEKDRCFQLFSMNDKSNRLFVGRFLGFFTTIFKDGKWVDEKVFDEIKITVNSIINDKYNNIWLSTSDGKLNRYIFKDKDSIIHSVEDYIYEQFDNKDGIPEGRYVEPAKIEDHLTFMTAKGLYKFNEKLKKIVPDFIFGDQYTNGNRIITKIVKDGKRDAYFVLYNFDTSIEYLIKDNKTNKYIIGKESFKRLQGLGAISEIYVDKYSNLWIGIGKKLYKYDRSKIQSGNKDFRTYIRKVVVGRDSIIFNGANFYEYSFTDSVKENLIELNQSDRFKVELAYN